MWHRESAGRGRDNAYAHQPLSLLIFAPLGFRALPVVLTMGDGQAQGTGQVVIPLLCLAGTQSERSQGLQGQPHVSHYGRYFIGRAE